MCKQLLSSLSSAILLLASQPLYAEIQQLITNGSFESGESGWSFSGDFRTGSAPEFPNPHSGLSYAFLTDSDGFPDNSLDGSFYQEVTIPAGTAPTTVFTFWYLITTDEPSGTQDELRVEIHDDSGNFIEELVELDNADVWPFYVVWSTDLDDYIGETIRIYFEGETNSSDPTVFRLDSISLLADVPECDRDPDSDTNAPSDSTDTSVTLHGDVDPNGCETEGWFMVGLSPDDLVTEVGRQSVGSGDSEVDIEYTYGGLQCGFTLYYEVFSENAAGVDNDGDTKTASTFPCPNPPEATTLGVSTVTETVAILNGTVDPNGSLTLYQYAYRLDGSNDSWLSVPDPAESAGSGSSPASVPVSVSGLTCNSTYEYYLVAVSEGGNSVGDTLTFTTLPCPGSPGAFTVSASDAFCDHYEPAGPAVRLYWTTSLEADSYSLYRDDTLYENGINIVGNTFLNSLGLQEGQVHSYYLYATIENGTTRSEDTVNVSVPFGVCDPPTFPPLNDDVDDGSSYGGSGSGGADPVCGDDLREPGEECDDGDANGTCPALCSASCTVNVCNSAPSISLIEPDGVGDEADGSFTIAWIDSDSDDDATITLSFSQDSGCSAPMLITSGISEDSATDSFSWDTSDVPEGHYWISASITDDGGLSDSDCSGPVTVVHPPDPNEIFSDGFESGDVTQWSESR